MQRLCVTRHRGQRLHARADHDIVRILRGQAPAGKRAQRGYPTDGEAPAAGLVQATNGDQYGTATYGGTNRAPFGCGTVFKITPSGTLTTIMASEAIFV